MHCNVSKVDLAFAELCPNAPATVTVGQLDSTGERWGPAVPASGRRLGRSQAVSLAVATPQPSPADWGSWTRGAGFRKAQQKEKQDQKRQVMLLGA